MPGIAYPEASSATPKTVKDIVALNLSGAVANYGTKTRRPVSSQQGGGPRGFGGTCR